MARKNRKLISIGYKSKMRIEDIYKLKSIKELKTVDDILAGIKERKKVIKDIYEDLNSIHMDLSEAGPDYYDYLMVETMRDRELQSTLNKEIIYVSPMNFR